MPPQNLPHEIVIDIGPDGKLESTVHGIDGPSCSELTKWLEELGTVERDEHTIDWRKQPRQGLILKR